MKTRPDWNEQKQKTLELIRNNSGKYNGVDIAFKLNHHGINNLKVIKGKFVSYTTELENEGLIYYDFKVEKWFAKDSDQLSSSILSYL